MKKLLFSVFFVSLIVLTFMSCNKKDEVVNPKQYVGFIAGEFNAVDGDVILKAAPIGVNRAWYMYRQNAINPLIWELVDGTEFIPGSDAYNFWQAPGNNPGVLSVSQSIYSNFTPIEQIRIVTRTLDADGKAAYLGINDLLPNAASFPITIKGRRLGDRVTLNTDALTSLPGYTNLSFSMSYNKSIIDVDGTAVKSLVTNSEWPDYTYLNIVPVMDQVVSGAGDVVVYDGLDAKITGTITIKIHLDNTTITKTVSATDIGHGLTITLKTTKVGWYDSGIINITDEDITPVVVDVTI